MPEVVDSLGCLLSFSGRERSSDRKAAAFAFNLRVSMDFS